MNSNISSSTVNDLTNFVADSDVLRLTDEAAMRHVSRTVEADRKVRGQFFTPPEVAGFMASLFKHVPPSCRLLDAGAGVGTLTVAVCHRLLDTGNTESLDVVAYEIDATAVALLEEILARCKVAAARNGTAFTSEIRIWDFIDDVIGHSGSLFAQPNQLFDLAIMNPPYFKLRADSDHAHLAKRIGPAQPNIYSLFMAAAVELLCTGGELVAITPRSFCNGRYFHEFRAWLLERVDLLQIHVFASRTEAFREAKVLQENVITHFRRRERSRKRSESIIVSRSFGRDFAPVNEDQLAYSRVIDNSCGDHLICIPDRPQDANIIEITEHWPGRFSDLGLRISTGPVVMFRTREFHTRSSNSQAVPLLTSHHIRDARITWPREKKKWPSAFVSNAHSQKHLIPTRNYVLLKRFSAKEERRRLSAGVLRADDFITPMLAIENHVNYIALDGRRMSLEETTGIAALFNSAIMDRYFRSFSGNTQVNATEIRTMKFPAIGTVREIGKQLIKDSSINHETVVMDQLGIEGDVRGYLEGFAH